MGSIGISPKRSGAEAKDALQRVGNPETPATEHQAADANHTALNQVDRVEQLIAKLETQSLALVPYGYWNQSQPQVKRSSEWLIAALLGCLWLSSLALAVVYLSSRHSSQVSERDVPTRPRVISAASDQQDLKTSESVNNLTEALENSSSRLDRIEAALQRSDQDFLQLKTRVGREATKPISRETEAVPLESKREAANSLLAPIGKSNQNSPAAPVANQAAAPAPSPLPSAPSVQALPNTTAPVLSIKPTDSAIPHKSDDGSIDYWLVARGAFKELARVQPIAVVADGVVIHNLDDGKDYRLSRQGEWQNVEW